MFATTGQGDGTASETSSVSSVRQCLMPSLVLFILNAVRGGRLRCILWLRPEECLLVCKIPMSKYLRFFCFCFPFKILQGERRDCFWGVWKFGWICSIQVGCQHELNYIWKLTSPLPSPLSSWTSLFLPPTPQKLRPREGEDSRHRKIWQNCFVLSNQSVLPLKNIS